jgi:site-specific DNA recombinase
MKCAIYSRYSSDRQSPTSIDDQIRKCREFAQLRGWQVLDEHVYSDKAISGALAGRDGLERMMAAATTKAFDCLLVDDSSRISRKLAEALNVSDQLRFAGVQIHFISQGYDTDSPQSEVLTTVHGLVDGLFIRELGAKTKRGLEGKVLRSLHAGGKIFGYNSQPIEDPERRDQYGRPLIAAVRLVIDQDQAKIVRKVFGLYADGASIKAVAKQLNREGIESPNPRAGRQKSWAPSSVRYILHNNRYRGMVFWGKTRKVRNPISGRRINRLKPEAEWIRVEIPEQRIVSEALWNRVQKRMEYVNNIFGDRGRRGGLLRSRAASSRYIFSGLLKCGSCGSNFTIVSGAGRNHRAADYGCPAHHFRGTCSNARRVASDVLERELLTKLQRDVLSDTAINYVLQQLEIEIGRQFADLDLDMTRMARRKSLLEAELKNLSRTIASGFDSGAVREAMVEREKELLEITAKTLNGKRTSVRTRLRDLRRFVTESLSDVRTLISGEHSNVSAVRMELARHIQSIMIEPKGERIRYVGKWHVLGNSECAEGQNRTAYAGLFRAALYR